MLIKFVIFDTSIGAEIFTMKMGESFFYSQNYGPYEDKVAYYEEFIVHYLLKNNEVIQGGDLNFTTKRVDIHGTVVEVDPLEDSFLNKIEEIKMVGVESIKLVPR